MAALAAVLSIALLGTVTSAATSHRTVASEAAIRYVAILWDPATPAAERKLWTVYLYTRAALVASERDAAPLPLGISLPTFEGEVRARRVAVGVFRQLERDDPDFGSRYFDDLDQVEAAGFMREYVWRYLKQPSWSEQPSGLRLRDFDAWRAMHLRYHVPVTYGRIAVRLAASGR
ncbi:MAG: hypothetical protein ACREUT_20230 [Steroidobacteraceae bacterium]